MITNEHIKTIFDSIIINARSTSTCNKLAVGSGFITTSGIFILESNRSIEHNCKLNNECYKAKLTGVYESVEWTRKYCKAIHAEVNMINRLKSLNIDPSEGTLYVTRYPCVNCANECVKAGFRHISYCGVKEISDEVKKIFDDANISVTWYPDIDYEFA